MLQRFDLIRTASLSLALGCCVASCSQSRMVQAIQSEPVSHVDVSIEATDYPAAEKIYLSFHNKYDHAVCISFDSWPTQNGMIGLSASRAYLIVDDETFGSLDWNGGLCKGLCSFKFEPGSVTEAALSYEAFGLPKELYGSEKKLTMKPLAFRC